MDGLLLHQGEIRRIAETSRPYPEGRFAGSGIVTCAGGSTYFPCAWVLVKLLRSLGCHRGRREMTRTMERLLETVPGVRCVNANALRPAFPLNGWELKPFAILHSRFEEVLFLDADNVPTGDPTFLLTSRPYRDNGAVFWPDRWMGQGDSGDTRTLSPEAWRACGLEELDEPEFETGQMVINKRKCLNALRLTMFLNAHSSFFYRWMLGDKDTFHLAWRRAGLSYAMPMHRPRQDGGNGPVLYQHDFMGRCLFQHRNQDKWSYDNGNARIAGFRHEDRCFEFLEELRRRWDGVVRRYPHDFTVAERRAVEQVTSARLFRYSLDGASSRLIELKKGFEVGLGKGEWETAWEVEEAVSGKAHLILRNAIRKMCVLDPVGEASWGGRCLHFERAPIRLEAASLLPARDRGLAAMVVGLLDRFPDDGGPIGEEIKATRAFTYRRVGHDSRTMEFVGDHTIVRGSAGCERWWFVNLAADSPELLIYGDHGRTCGLRRRPDGGWTGDWEQFERMPVELIPNARAAGGGGASYYGTSSKVAKAGTVSKPGKPGKVDKPSKAGKPGKAAPGRSRGR